MDIEDNEKKIIEENLKKLQNISQKEIDTILETKEASQNPIKEQELNKLLDCAHEIVFTINAHVLTQNEKGELTGTKEICVKNYHIPVPIDKDYNHYMKTFFEYLEKKIIETIQDTNKDSKNKEEEEKN